MKQQDVVAVLSLLLLLTEAAAKRIETSSCAGAPFRGEHCAYSCHVTGLQPGEFFTISKVLAVNHSWKDKREENTVYTLYNSSDGLNPALKETGRYRVIEHEDSQVTLNITDILPADSGFFACIIHDEDGDEVLMSIATLIPVLGVRLELTFSPDVEELTMTKEELHEKLKLMVNVTETMSVPPVVEIFAFYLNSNYGDFVEDDFQLEDDISFTVEEGGLSHGSSFEVLSKPNVDFLRTNLGKPMLNARYSHNFDKPLSPIRKIIYINLQFAPEIVCKNIPSAVMDRSLKVTCEFSANPAADSFKLKLPSGTIIDGTEDGYELHSTPTTTEWLYNFIITYQRASSSILGTNTIYITNKYGERNATFLLSEGDTANMLRISYILLSLSSMLTIFMRQLQR